MAQARFATRGSDREPSGLSAHFPEPTTNFKRRIMVMSRLLDDHSLVLACRAGQTEAFGTLVAQVPGEAAPHDPAACRLGGRHGRHLARFVHSRLREARSVPGRQLVLHVDLPYCREPGAQQLPPPACAIDPAANAGPTPGSPPERSGRRVARRRPGHPAGAAWNVKSSWPPHSTSSDRNIAPWSFSRILMVIVMKKSVRSLMFPLARFEAVCIALAASFASFCEDSLISRTERPKRRLQWQPIEIRPQRRAWQPADACGAVKPSPLREVDPS